MGDDDLAIILSKELLDESLLRCTFRILRSRVNRFILLCVRERLLVGQCRVLEENRENDQRDTKADTDDAQDALGVLVRVDDGGSCSRADGVEGGPSVGRSVDLSGEGGIADCLFELLGQDLRPDGT
jgi:hypothetical protein